MGAASSLGCGVLGALRALCSPRLQGTHVSQVDSLCTVGWKDALFLIEDDDLGE